MPNIKWAYMDHWMMESPRGLVEPNVSRKYMEQYLKQIAALGFQGLDTFVFRLLGRYNQMFGSPKAFQHFLQDYGIEKIVSVFHAYPYATKDRAAHVRTTHDDIFGDCVGAIRACEGLGIENFIIMPTSTYFQTEPVTDESIKIVADLWNRVGRMTLEHGIKTTSHHEFWCGIRSAHEIEKFYEYTDPQYVFYFCDAAQHIIAGVDPVEVYSKYHDRCSGFHFKDTHTVDTKGEYRLPPDAELMAPSVRRWFWEMGTPEGLVDFPALMHAIKRFGYRGWISVEHDGPDRTGGDYAESTCIARWYIDNILSKIYS
jgi:inosose dehydratase